jgi:hypothetical protein
MRSRLRSSVICPLVMASGVSPSRGREAVAQVAVGETVGQQPEDAQDGEQGLHAGAGEGHPGGAGACGVSELGHWS